MNNVLRHVCICACVLAWSGYASAALITFDSLTPTANAFANTEAQSTIRPGAITELVLDPVGDQRVTISRLDGARFDLVDNTLPRQTGKDLEWGFVVPVGQPTGGLFHASLDPFFDPSPKPFIFTFEQPITFFSILVGDFGGDGDSVQLKAFSEGDLGGTLRGTVTQTLPFLNQERTWTDTRISYFNPLGFESVSVISGVGNNTAFFDRLYYVEVAVNDALPPNLDDPTNLGDFTVRVLGDPVLFDETFVDAVDRGKFVTNVLRFENSLIETIDVGGASNGLIRIENWNNIQNYNLFLLVETGDFGLESVIQLLTAAFDGIDGRPLAVVKEIPGGIYKGVPLNVQISFIGRPAGTIGGDLYFGFDFSSLEGAGVRFVAIPSPAAGWAGLALLGVLARRRRCQTPRR